MITSTANQQVKHLIQLQKKGKLRKEEGVFVVEGGKMFREAPLEWIENTYVSEDFLKKEENGLLKGRKFEVVENRVFKTMSDTMAPQGILSIVRQPKYNLQDLLLAERPHLLLLENLQDPGNLGTIVRTGEGAGITGILMSRDTVDIFNPKTIRSTMGSIYRVPFLYVEDFKRILPELKKRKIRTYAAHLKGKENYDQKSFLGGTAFMIGNEGNGLSEELASLAEEYLKIPMCGQVESLNAAIAAGILMYEVHRQRENMTI